MKEFADFLRAQTPYDAFPVADLERLASQVEVEYVLRGTDVVAAGDPPLRHVWVVRTGSVVVLEGDRVVDQLTTGDTFGQVSLLTGKAPALVVRAVEDSLLYRLPDLRAVVGDPALLRFRPYGEVRSRLRAQRAERAVAAARRTVAAHLRPLVRCGPGATVGEVADAIRQAHQSCAVIETADGLAIVTDSDFRSAYAAGIGPGSPAAAIAHAPVRTVGDRTPVPQAFLTMIEHGVHHLVVTDGSDRAVGVVRVVDLASAEVRDPLVVRAAIEAASDLDGLVAASALLPSTAVQLTDSGIAPSHVGALLAVVREALLLKAIDLVGPDPGDDGRRRSWLVLGSLARREPLPGSDLDTALVWDDDPAGGDPAGGDPAGGDPAGALRAAAGRVQDAMLRCGIPPCPDGANASSPLFSRSRGTWERAAVSWVADPFGEAALLLATMLADSRPVTDLPLGRGVIDAMLAAARPESFLPMLLRFTLVPKPPTGFVRDFVVEHSGEQRGRLDLKRGGLMPVAALGRWAAMVSGDDRGSTPERLRRGADAGLFSADEADVLVGAFELCFGLLLDQEVDAIRSGAATTTFLDPKGLDSLTRRYLREAFREVARVQWRVENEWTLRLA